MTNAQNFDFRRPKHQLRLPLWGLFAYLLINKSSVNTGQRTLLCTGKSGYLHQMDGSSHRLTDSMPTRVAVGKSIEQNDTHTAAVGVATPHPLKSMYFSLPIRRHLLCGNDGVDHGGHGAGRGGAENPPSGRTPHNITPQFKGTVSAP